MQKKIIIIGGGIAGIAAGIYLQKNGYDTLILEQCSQPGGVAVSWKRKEYVFDGATNWLPGSAFGINFHAMLREVLDFSKLSFVDFEEFMHIEHEGEIFHVYSDAMRLKQEMLRLAPQDSIIIEKFTSAIVAASKCNVPLQKPLPLFSIFDFVKIGLTSLPLVRLYMVWKNLTIRDFTEGFKSKMLGSMLRKIFPRHDFFSVLSIILSFSWMHKKSAGYPLGGSYALHTQLLDNYKKSGGVVRCNSHVNEITLQDGVAIGVTTAAGEMISGDYIVSAGDLRSSCFSLLPTHYAKSNTKLLSDDHTLFPGMIQVSVGVANALVNVCHKIVCAMHEPLMAGTDCIVDMMIRVGNFDATFAPVGHATLIVHLRTTDPHYWIDLRQKDIAHYKVEKDRVARHVIESLEKRFGNIKDALKAIDVATPATYVRYNSVYKGSYQGYAPTPAMIGKSFAPTIAGVKNLYLTGQWSVPPGGIPRVIIASRHVAHMICARDKKTFIAQEI